MDISASQCSSGCESGWTRYLDQSSLSETQFHIVGGTDDYHRGKGAEMEEKEEDLSLLSDASSGPSHYLEDDEECIHDNGCYFYSSSASERDRKNKSKIKAKEHGRHRLHSSLDDTASSPALSFSKVDSTLYGNEDSKENLLNFSQGFSATHFEVKSTVQKHFTFLKPFAKKPDSEEPGGFHRNWK
ncbi:protein SOB FIVE-LIKE 5-like [Juglans microcarpa x Juglans regia]|uniref:protein SOB FIVE-LIKE 5-like n=1 Tax=Juglans microcarpa x Juglans regia TaxID=2249226 RepID=UPI001B7DF185|nr:protein SOB FIVE-LIKE 5-like [Juglans microcarpa x Juglans regia]